MEHALITIAITDVEGSTALHVRLGEAAAQRVLHEHVARVVSAVNRYHGRVIKTLGHGILATFASARDALTCSIEIQRLEQENSAADPDRGVHVRIGINSGDVVDADEDVHGAAVAAADRIMRQAHGGEVLVADVVRRLAGTMPEMSFVDYGEVKLKGFAESTRLYRLRSRSPQTMRATRPETRYAKSGEVSIAYQVVGDGPLDLVMVPGFVSHVEVAWEEPNYARFLSRLASFSRLILFDKRGTGLSDPVTTVPTMALRMDDIRAVMDNADSRAAAIFGVSEGGTLSLLFARAHPERARALILYGSWARRLAGPDYAWGMKPKELEPFLARMSAAWATGEWWTGPPVALDDERHRIWWARYLRMSASPAMARDVMRMNAAMDVRDQLPKLNLPILIMHRTGDNWIDVGHARYLAEHLPHARYVELPGTDHRPWLEDTEALLTEMELFLTGAKQRPRRRVAVGVESLSRREREIARMAAAGETARAIATRLFLSERTVETHLASAYAKLGVRSKAELIRRAAELAV